MNPERLVLAFTLVVSLVLGVTVYLTNPRRMLNQAFLLLCFVLAGWLESVLLVFSSSTPGLAALWIRSASITGAAVPLALTFLRTAVRFPTTPLHLLSRAIPGWICTFSAIAIYCFTPFYLKGATLPPQGVPDAVYGQYSLIYPLYLICGMVWVGVELAKELRRSTGLARIELQYIFAGLLCILCTCLVAGVAPLITHNSQVVALAPLCLTAMNGILAYGIATKKILSVGTLVRRVFSYALLVAYLATLYFGAWWGVNHLLRGHLEQAPFIAHLAGALVAALAMSRANSVLQAFLRRLFINFHGVDLRETLRAADSMLSQVSTTDHLLDAFTRMLSKATGTDLVAVVLFSDVAGHKSWSTGAVNAIHFDDPLPQALSQTHSPFAWAEAARQRTSPAVAAAAGQLKNLPGAIALGIWSGEKLVGTVVLGDKLSGRLYDSEEQETLQILINRLAVALENAQLYTEQRRSKMYLETLLSELTSGVVAVDENALITVCNREAASILDRPVSALVGQSSHSLPPLLHLALTECLRLRSGVRDQMATLDAEGVEPLPIRFSSQIIGEINPGAFVVFNDLSNIRRLELQLRRADRLSILGTMSTSVAHEIRNPLNPIKTFAALVPERQNDVEFLLRFAKIVTTQVEKIESLVTRLLSFSHPKPPQRTHVHTHTVLEDTLTLLSHDLHRKEIQVVKDFAAASDRILADRQQLEQVFLNVTRNASEAMPEGGTLTVSTQVITPGIDGETAEYIEIKIQDDGAGIDEGILSVIFDPFTTDKESGTGLGLSIVLGIIVEHGGTIQISNENAGALVQIRLPIESV